MTCSAHLGLAPPPSRRVEQWGAARRPQPIDARFARRPLWLPPRAVGQNAPAHRLGRCPMATYCDGAGRPPQSYPPPAENRQLVVRPTFVSSLRTGLSLKRQSVELEVLLAD